MKSCFDWYLESIDLSICGVHFSLCDNLLTEDVDRIVLVEKSFFQNGGFNVIVVLYANFLCVICFVGGINAMAFLVYRFEK